MCSGRYLSLLGATVLLSVGAGCAGVKTMGTHTDGGAGSTGTGGSGPIIDARMPLDTPPIDPSKCGNGMIDNNEQCDDGNKIAGDGCSMICQIPAGWTCTGMPSVCNMAGVCGDSILGATEACDDGNAVAGDGCSADCKGVDPGYECRVPGRKCVPACGDGMIKGGEQCDDSNTTNDDGCSGTCQIEPGASCPKTAAGAPAPGMCTATVCGNGVKEGTEGCDCGDGTVAVPAGCPGPNGLFTGSPDATKRGCSKTCTQEPACRMGTGTMTTRACDQKCGNGNVETGEDCDDGNLDPGDGCSATCTVEGGFMCSTQMLPDTVGCTKPGNAGQCLELPITYRDFKNESVTGGHPDFFYLGATVANPVMESGVQGQSGAISFSKRYCVPNSSGPAKKNDCANRSWDMSLPNLDANGKPAFNMARPGGTNADCQFIDWSHDTNSNRVPGITMAQSPTIGLTYTDGASGHPMYRGPAPLVTSAASFGQWWVDSTFTGNTHTVSTLEMAPIGGGQYQYSSQVNSVLGGFFPIDPNNQFTIYGTATGAPGAMRTAAGGEALLCNLWPYWYAGATVATATPGFGAVNNCIGNQYLFPPSLMTTVAAPFTPANWNVALNMMYAGGHWYPEALGPNGVQGWFHNSWFTDEARYLFTHTGAFSLQFYGDDDMFIFINGQLVVDLGGVHQRLPGRVDVTAAGMATITEGGSLNPQGTMILPCPSADPYTMLTMNAAGNADGNGHMNCTITNCDCRTRSVNLGLTMGRTYEIAVFGADRHPTESNYQLTLSGFATNRSNCMPRCGDGVATGAEECDCGDTTPSSEPTCAGKTNDGSYGGCTTMCKYGPYCGDAVMDAAAGEECDAGSRNNNKTYGTLSGGCAPGCKLPHYCGDGILDDAEGEGCDFGTNNGMTGVCCSATCGILIDC